MAIFAFLSIDPADRGKWQWFPLSRREYITGGSEHVERDGLGGMKTLEVDSDDFKILPPFRPIM
jgi:hypothetical protein